MKEREKEGKTFAQTLFFVYFQATKKSKNMKSEINVKKQTIGKQFFMFTVSGSRETISNNIYFRLQFGEIIKGHDERGNKRFPSICFHTLI